MHTSARRPNVVPASGTWSLLSAVQGGAEISDAQLDKLHRLAALIPPTEAAEREALKRDLAGIVHLVETIHRTPGKAVDARPLVAHDAQWNTSLSTSEGKEGERKEGEGTQTLERDQLLERAGDRQYAGYFVVDRT